MLEYVPVASRTNCTAPRLSSDLIQRPIAAVAFSIVSIFHCSPSERAIFNSARHRTTDSSYFMAAATFGDNKGNPILALNSFTVFSSPSQGGSTMLPSSEYPTAVR